MSLSGPSTGILSRFTVLGGAAHELWLVFGTKLLTILAYSVMNSTLVLWLSSDLGYSDMRAGSVVAAWSALMTLTTVLVGSVAASSPPRAVLLRTSSCNLGDGFHSTQPNAWLWGMRRQRGSCAGAIVSPGDNQSRMLSNLQDPQRAT